MADTRLTRFRRIRDCLGEASFADRFVECRRARAEDTNVMTKDFVIELCGFIRCETGEHPPPWDMIRKTINTNALEADLAFVCARAVYHGLSPHFALVFRIEASEEENLYMFMEKGESLTYLLKPYKGVDYDQWLRRRTFAQEALETLDPALSYRDYYRQARAEGIPMKWSPYVKDDQQNARDVFDHEIAVLSTLLNDKKEAVTQYMDFARGPAIHYILQIIMSLLTLSFGLNMEHGDLHRGQFIAIPTEDTHLTYQAHGREIYVRTHGYIICMIDFGRSARIEDTEGSFHADWDYFKYKIEALFTSDEETWKHFLETVCAQISMSDLDDILDILARYTAPFRHPEARVYRPLDPLPLDGGDYTWSTVFPPHLRD